MSGENNYYDQNNNGSPYESIDPSQVYAGNVNYANGQDPSAAINYKHHNAQSPARKRKAPWLTIGLICVALLLVCAISVTIVFAKTFLIGSDENGGSDNGTTPPISDGSGSGSGSADINKNETPDHNSTTSKDENGYTVYDTVDLVELMLPSVVYVESTFRTGAGSGSGIILTDDGYILTNAHVIEGATSVMVKTNDQKEYSAEIVGYDSSYDVGVLKIKGTFTAAEFGDSDKAKIGESVIAIGTPFSEEFFQTVTKGIVSGIRKDIVFTELGAPINAIQHDAVINGGNSGGPLVNMYGQVIGINSYKLSGDNENICFAISINESLKIAEDIIKYGQVEKPYLGVSIQTESVIGGVRIVEVFAGSAAEKAGLRFGDVITKVDGQRVVSVSDITGYIADCKIGQKVTLTVIRDGSAMEVSVVLGSSLDQEN